MTLFSPPNTITRLLKSRGDVIIPRVCNVDPTEISDVPGATFETMICGRDDYGLMIDFISWM